jgi:hypothetical protein
MSFSSSPEIINKVLTLADTEYQIDLPLNVTRIRVSTRDNQDIKLAFRNGQSGTVYFTVKPDLPPFEVENIAGVAALYVQSPAAGLTVEVVTWR